MMTSRDLLDGLAYTREEVDRFLDPNEPNWARFDPELGYLLKDCVMRDGIDECQTIATYPAPGARRIVNYAGRPCRINSYGNSFTQCHQVSDGESWQEYLAAHFGEPIRNYGIGGYGVFQAYRRMVREEATDAGAQYLLLNIYTDDHYRSIDTWRGIRMGKRFHKELIQRKMFHANAWTHARVDLDTGVFEERSSLGSTTDFLYELCDQERVHELFGDDIIVQILVARDNGKLEGCPDVQRLADCLNVELDLSSADKCRASVEALHTTYALRSSEFVVERAASLARDQGKKLMVLMSYDEGRVREACEGQSRFDQAFIDYLARGEVPYVDTLRSHLDDFKCFNLSAEEYIRRYYIGHYNPAGNHFFAFAVKDAIADWLDPPPPTYCADEDPCQRVIAGLA